MKIDHQYIKSLLDAFLDSPLPTITLKDIPGVKVSGETTDETHKLVFHLEILRDQGLIEGAGKNRSSIGISRTRHDYVFSIIDLRLTANGHDFAAALNKPGVMETLTTTFKELGPSETIKAAFKLSFKATDKALSALVDD